MKKKSILVALIALVMIPTLAQAKSDGEHPKRSGLADPEKIFEQLDTDQNGGISEKEAKGPMAKRFNRLDADSSGEITKEELTVVGDKMRQQKKKKSGKKFEEIDSNGNGSISKNEADPRMLKNFEKLDENGDGTLAKEELRAVNKKHKGKREDDQTREI